MTSSTIVMAVMPRAGSVLLSSENVTLIVQRICHPLSIWNLRDLRQGWSGPGVV
ncbi:MAG: hypothetical protein J7L92_05460 [Dehalococcoidia bacterium]|nr:hypothetical protein [Dehalococcoidia bacterium]